MYECFHCGMKTVVWGADFSLDEWEPETEEKGLVHTLYCSNCGAEITYIIREKGEE